MKFPPPLHQLTVPDKLPEAMPPPLTDSIQVFLRKNEDGRQQVVFRPDEDTEIRIIATERMLKAFALRDDLPDQVFLAVIARLIIDWAATSGAEG
ncbi:hypothetical protein KIH74_22840 [Kineosporia sp. J2-2]|uniref:Uncharacterized protein n=1 Tax=Kineosporia corallincola TaxID=2835133 RepID=A0ABS5TL17_9ACTN|nr:hypothetical protein [Kineosporia corallincola]MBT0771796.1 hypothetical protein [Kineosporia corallincola]